MIHKTPEIACADNASHKEPQMMTYFEDLASAKHLEDFLSLGAKVSPESVEGALRNLYSLHLGQRILPEGGEDAGIFKNKKIFDVPYDTETHLGRILLHFIEWLETPLDSKGVQLTMLNKEMNAPLSKKYVDHKKLNRLMHFVSLTAYWATDRHLAEIFVLKDGEKSTFVLAQVKRDNKRVETHWEYETEEDLFKDLKKHFKSGSKTDR